MRFPVCRFIDASFSSKTLALSPGSFGPLALHGACERRMVADTTRIAAPTPKGAEI
ncbi:hypothetical protein OP10G_3529 [Fimbriimonas ginsengisoli Gsoil 348]|uniref:Uncharacterized protein n=1 Tax=Fimbriimonas ginsengisoli Gsoil 348 TaxID=661478 RepID=A0A068NU52_FIMGI|nr:hypothetical protein OP10G_3529 [Fimbriimonas ginsengisoli Gsoil 348]